MRYASKFIMLIVIIAALLQGACAAADDGAATKPEPPSKTEKVDGSDFNRVILTEKAAARVQVKTSKVREEEVAGAKKLVVPYASLIYGLHGETWVYTSPAPLTFQRAVVAVDYIEGENAYLKEGPAVGTEVADVAVAELYGADTGVGK